MEKLSKNCVSNKEPFIEFKCVEPLIKILESRLPHSANIYNLALLHKNYKNDLKFFTINGNSSEDCWILTKNKRKDTGNEYCISKSAKSEFTAEIYSAFVNTSVINWNDTFKFSSVDPSISYKIFEISSFVKGNATKFHPCYFYVLPRDEAMNLKVEESEFMKNEIEEGLIEIKKLDPELGSEFFFSTWKYAVPDTLAACKKILERSESIGIYYNGKPVSGLTVSSHGLLGMLFTLEEHRKKGYGKFCMQELMRRIAIKKFVPCSTVEIRNKTSIAFHESVGMKVASRTDFVVYINKGF